MAAQVSEDKEKFLKTPLAFIRSNLLEYIKSDDPLGAILEGYKRDIDNAEVDGGDLF